MGSKKFLPTSFRSKILITLEKREIKAGWTLAQREEEEEEEGVFLRV